MSSIPADECIKEIIDNILSIPVVNSVKSMEEIGRSCLEKLAHSLESGEVMSIDTGFKKLDSLLCGIPYGSLVVVGADSGFGKTAFALNLVRYWCELGIPVLYNNLEMNSEDLFKRLALAKSYQKNVILSNYDFKDITEKTLETVGAIHSITKEYPIGVFKDSCVHSICQKAKQSSAQVVIVDHLHLLDGAHRYEDLVKATRTLQQLADSTGKIVVLLAQYNRSKYGRENKDPQPSDFRGSGTIEQDAAIILQMNCPDYENSPEDYILHITKARHSSKGTVPFKFNRSKQFFEEASNAL